MPAPNLFRIFVSRLNKLSIPYMIEYVILRKLEYYREGESEKHLRDISSILEFSSNGIDFKLLETQIIERTLQKEWMAARNF